jgi:HlyD family secretion protein
VDADLQKLRIDKAHKARRDERSAWPWALVAVLVLLLGGFGLWQWRAASAAAAPAVQTVRVRVPEPGSAEAESVVLHGSGYVMAAHKIELAAKVIGRMAWVGVEMGDKVEKGQVVARLEDDEFKARLAVQQGQLESARAKLAELEAGSRPEEIAMAKAAVEKSEAELSNAQVNFKRLNEAGPGTVSRQEIDNAEALEKSRKAELDSQRKQYELAKIGPRKEQIDAQRAAVRQLQGSVAMAQIDLDNTVIRSPVHGTVLARNVEVGEFITTGFVGDRGAKGFIVSMADLNDLRVELDISQNDFAKVAPQQPCRIVTDAYPDRKYNGVVDLISPEANRQKATIEVRVKVLDPDERLKPDLNATVSFLTPHASTTQASSTSAAPMIRVPASAVRDGVVFVVENGRAVKRSVDVLKGGVGAEVEIRAGLIGGEDLIVSPPETLQDGAKVRVQETRS